MYFQHKNEYSLVSTTDVTDVASSLVQLMCDTHYRTITGLESLVQKEWVAMVHPFTSRSGLVTEDSTEDDEGKVSYYTLSPVVVTEFAVTISHIIFLLKYLPLITCHF